MTFTDEQIERQKEKLTVLRYLVDGRIDDLNAAQNLYDAAYSSWNKQVIHIEFMKQNKETK